MVEGKRVTKDRYYLSIARAVAMRSPCVKARYGAVVVVGDAIVSTGYNGPVRGGINCEGIGCLKLLKAPEHGRGYEWCNAVHAEENAIINAARTGAKVLGGVMYVSGFAVRGGEIHESTPCTRCKRAIINAGIEKVITEKSDGTIVKYDVKDWIREDAELYLRELERATREAGDGGAS